MAKSGIVNMKPLTRTADNPTPQPMKAGDVLEQTRVKQPQVTSPVSETVSIHKTNPSEIIVKLKEVTSMLNDLMKSKQMGLNFRVDQASGRVVMQVVDSLTGELIRQIPGDDVLKVAESITNLKGLIFNKSL